ncbi:hypothetical protein [Chitinophaga agri]|uniref:Uncharacterized protein n=1 Tax=Chitinophaga agri TaxID=2703787 RepID=A0A6B9ZJP4_9BACT|nr:hypothetical protein [Chitinophaga agri]QHS62019.1 hypothetical protein GWR21_21140 [Chitinophaga agri]
MSNISEQGFCAGWMGYLEYDLWRIMQGGHNRYGQYYVSQEEMDTLWAMVDKCGCWIVFDDDKEETAVDLDTWKEMYARYVNGNHTG